MKLTELVPSNSKFLGKDDVPKEGLNLTIRGFKREEMKQDDGTTKQKAVVYWEEQGVKPMILNLINSQLIALHTNATTTGECKGKVVNVYCDPTVIFQGKLTGGLRIRAAQAVSQPVADSADDDDLSV